ncbi:MAG: hypothetical protein IJR52_00040, partial [Selenomonadaceae bacterium]|nr:hypothetical protein [Selenomonadaceae bacterium]
MSPFEKFLQAGERVRLEDGARLALIESGKVEVYLVTSEAGSFRQQFLVELEAGAAAFPSLDEFEETETLIYAAEDSKIKILTFDEVPTDELRIFMRRWFAELIKLPWLRLLADKGDDILITWLDGTVLEGVEDLTEAFRANEEIFSMLLGVRFRAEDKRFSDRVEVRARNQRRILDNSISNLLGEETTT